MAVTNTKPSNTKSIIAKNTLWNLISRVILLPIGILAIPALVRGMGTERFGLFSLCWTILGYFTILDLGLGQTTTKYVTSSLSTNDTRDVYKVIGTTSGILLAFGILLGIAIAIVSPWLIINFLKAPDQLIFEGIQMLRLLAIAIPFIFLSNSLRGALEAKQRFDLI